MSQRALIISLVVSVALNLFGVGAVVGGLVIAHRLHGMGPPPPAMMGPGPLWAAADGLPPAHRDAYRNALHQQAQGLVDQVRAAREARRAAWTSLRTEPLNSTAVSASLAKARDLEMRARVGVEQTIVDFAATLPPPERAQLSEALVKSGGNMRMEIRRRPHRPLGVQDP